MNNNYAKTLESYIIPAQEGFWTGAAIVVGGFTLLSVICSVGDKMKLKQQIKRNGGNPADYGKKIYDILRRYSNDINGVLEPVNKDKYLKSLQKLESIAKECGQIRNQFSSINPTDSGSITKYKAMLSKIKTLDNKAKVVIEEIESIDLSEVNQIQVKFNDSFINKIQVLDNSIWVNCVDGGHDGYSLIMTEDFYFSDDKYDAIEEIQEANDCVDAFDELANFIAYTNDGYDIRNFWEKYVKKCKFAINPNSKLNKKK